MAAPAGRRTRSQLTGPEHMDTAGRAGKKPPAGKVEFLRRSFDALPVSVNTGKPYSFRITQL